MPKSAAAKAFGGGSYAKDDMADMMDADESEDMPDEDDSGLPPDFESAYDAYVESPSAQTFWDAVEACTAAPKGGIGLLIEGKPKK